MNKYVKILKRHIAENPPNYGDGDASAILDMLYCYYHECNNTDDDNVKAALRICINRCTVCRSEK